MKSLDVFKYPFLLYPCIALAVWDTITTGLGTLAILDSGSIGSFVASFVITAFVAAILLGSTVIAKDGLGGSNPEFPQVFLTFLLVVAVFYDLYTSFYGARYVTIDPELELRNSGADFSQWLVVILLTVLSVSASVICSWVFFGSKVEE